MTPAADTIASILWSAASAYPQRPALLQGGESTSFRQLATDVRRLTGWLVGHGVARGQHVALLVENSRAFVVAHYALATIGAVIAPLNHHFRGRTLYDALALSDATLVVSSTSLAEALRSLPSCPPAVSGYVILDGAGVAGSPMTVRLGDPNLDLVSPETPLLAAEGDGPMPPAPGADDAAVLFLTSGTTGRPKGIRLTNRQALLGIDAWVERWSYGPSTVSLMVAPFFHVVYNPLVLGAHRRGGAAAIVGSPQARAATREIESSRATAVMGTPFFYMQLLADHTSLARDLSSVGTLIYGAAPTPASVIRALQGQFPSARLFNCYGLTETASALSCLGPEELEGREASVGRPHPGVLLSIHGEDHREVECGVVGEVWCRGPNVISAYYNSPEANSGRFRGPWLRTGDMGYLDGDGFLYLLGRCDDLINIAGEKAYPCEIENVLYRHPDVLDAAVSVVTDPQKGHRVKAFVVPRAARALDVRDLKQFCLHHLPPTFVPKAFEIVEALPRNPSGKVLRRELGDPRGDARVDD
jgi:acyl-CoA synthetase (AMP-forming)/AMP-acid ligase II